MTDQKLYDKIKTIIETQAQINYAGDMAINTDTLAQLIMHEVDKATHHAYLDGVDAGIIASFLDAQDNR